VDAAEAQYRWSHIPGEPVASKDAWRVREGTAGNGSIRLSRYKRVDTALAVYFIKGMLASLVVHPVRIVVLRRNQKGRSLKR